MVIILLLCKQQNYELIGQDQINFDPTPTDVSVLCALQLVKFPDILQPIRTSGNFTSYNVHIHLRTSVGMHGLYNGINIQYGDNLNLIMHLAYW